MRKRGSIQERGDDRWLVSVYVGLDPDTSKRHYLRRTVRGSRDDAESARAALISQVDEKYLKRRKANTPALKSAARMRLATDRFLKAGATEGVYVLSMNAQHRTRRKIGMSLRLGNRLRQHATEIERGTYPSTCELLQVIPTDLGLAVPLEAMLHWIYKGYRVGSVEIFELCGKIKRPEDFKSFNQVLDAFVALSRFDRTDFSSQIRAFQEVLEPD